MIAEIGVNHNGDPKIAHEMIDAAKKSGADAVKFQTFIAEDLVDESAPKAAYQIKSTGQGKQIDMLRALELPASVYRELRSHCAEVNVDFISTAFEATSLERVLELEPACIKWPSGELDNWPLLSQAAASALPVLLSTGMGNLAEIASAIEVLESGGCSSIAVLQCVSNYPARIEDQNLRTIATMSQVFGKPVGFSDHTLGPYAAIAARSLGMCILEKHFTLDRNAEGPDHRASMEVPEFGEMVRALRAIEIGLGDGVKRRLAVEEDTRMVARKSLFFASDLPIGHTLSDRDIDIKRPSGGLPPSVYDMVLGRVLSRSAHKGELIKLENL